MSIDLLRSKSNYCATSTLKNERDNDDRDRYDGLNFIG
ncbi:hypothetical protein CKA32_004387 [Geitlerinema sp. FC II]|nr:hypothetical protein CKA32_004387 [Geitlerinema sp. FC II]